MFRKKKDCQLLPHIKEPIFGLSSGDAQIFPWAINMFNVPRIWHKSDGEHVTVAVIDTGCDLYHNDLKNNIIQGINILDNKKDPIDDNGHGTHVAGTIAAINNMFGIVGVSPKTKIMPVKCLDKNGSGSHSQVAEGIKWAANSGADIITMSLGSNSSSISIERSIQIATEKGVVIFCAAGNSGHDNDINYPAKYPETISVGAVNRHLNICKFSCTGDSLDFLAPGEDIISCSPNNGYSSMSGTSMATPFAVGCASLWLSLLRSNNSSIKPSKLDYIEHFKSNTLPLNGKYRGIRKYEGFGVIQPTL